MLHKAPVLQHSYSDYEPLLRWLETYKAYLNIPAIEYKCGIKCGNLSAAISDGQTLSLEERLMLVSFMTGQAFIFTDFRPL